MTSSIMAADLRNLFVSAEATDDHTVVLTLSGPDAIIYDKARGLTFHRHRRSRKPSSTTAMTMG